MSKPVSLIYGGDALVPERQEDAAELKSRYGDGEIVVTDLRPHIDQPRLGEFWAVIGKALPQLKTTVQFNLCWEDAESLADAVKIGVGHRRLCHTIHGKPYFRSKSLADIDDWDRFMAAVYKLLTGEMKLDERTLRTANVANVAKNEAAAWVKDLSRDAVTPAMCMDKFLVLADDPAFSDDLMEHRQAAIRKLTEQWQEMMPAHANFIRRCGVTAMDIADGRMTLDAGRKLLQAQLPK